MKSTLKFIFNDPPSAAQLWAAFYQLFSLRTSEKRKQFSGKWKQQSIAKYIIHCYLNFLFLFTRNSYLIPATHNLCISLWLCFCYVNFDENQFSTFFYFVSIFFLSSLIPQSTREIVFYRHHLESLQSFFFIDFYQWN